MGKWSQYRLRGTVRNVGPPPVVMLLERSETASPTTQTVAAAGSTLRVAAKPVIISTPGWTVTKVAFSLLRTGTPLNTNFRAVFWPQSAGLPVGPRLGSSAWVSGNTFGLATGWIDFSFGAGLIIPGPLAVFLGIEADASGGVWALWKSGGITGGGRSFSGVSDPPNTNNSAADWPWLRVFGFET